MYKGHSIGVVVPAYNERAHIGEVLDTVPPIVDRVYVVDDASTDDTWDVIERHVSGGLRAGSNGEHAGPDSGSPTIVPIRHDENRGVGSAIKTGYLRARRDDLDVVAVIAGDGQMDPTRLDALLDPVVSGEADYAKGNRLADPSHHDEMPRFRYVGNTLLTALTRIASGYWGLTDPQNGYTAISSRALEAIDVDAIFEYYGYCNDILVKLHVAGLRVADVPLPAEYGDETSHIRYTSYVPRVSWMLFRNFLWRIRREYGPLAHPAGAGYVVGMLGGLLGLSLAVTGDRNSRRRRVLGPAVFVAGALSFLAGAAIEARRDLSSTADRTTEQADAEGRSTAERAESASGGAREPVRAGDGLARSTTNGGERTEELGDRTDGHTDPATRGREEHD